MSKDKVTGVNCHVTDCVYHKTSDKCTAEEIVIQGPQAKDPSNTLCQTFQCK